MAQAKGNKAKGRQSAKHAGRYAAQFHRTTANKARRAAARKRWLERRQAKRNSLAGMLATNNKQAAWARRRIAKLERDVQHEEAAKALFLKQDKSNDMVHREKVSQVYDDRIAWTEIRIAELRDQYCIRREAV
jgi:hypothetical protein